MSLKDVMLSTVIGRRLISKVSEMDFPAKLVHSSGQFSKAPDDLRMSVTPELALVDDNTLKISVARLSKRERITLHSSVTENGMTFAAVGHYEADDTGAIDTTRDPSLGGSFVGVEPMGMLWGMKQAPGQRSGLRLMKKDVTQPFKISLHLHRSHLGLVDLYKVKPTPLISKAIHRSYMGNGVKRIPVEYGRVRGTLFLPRGDCPTPGVIDMFGAVAGLVELRAALLASRGFASLALAYFNYQDLPKTYRELDLDYFEQAADFLLSHPRVLRNNGLGVVGVSKGCEVAYAISEVIPEVKAVVGINGFCYACDTDYTRKGKVVKVAIGPDMEKMFVDDEGAVSLENGFPTEVPESSMFQIEKSNASFLFIRGLDDKCVSPKASVVAPERFRKFGRTDFVNLEYPNAGHLIEPPYGPHVRYTYHQFPTTSTLVNWGGETVGHAKAQEDAWPRLLDFLNEKLAGGVRVASKL